MQIQLIFDKGRKNTQWGKASPFNSVRKTVVLGKLDIHTQKNETGPLS